MKTHLSVSDPSEQSDELSLLDAEVDSLENRLLYLLRPLEGTVLDRDELVSLPGFSSVGRRFDNGSSISLEFFSVEEADESTFGDDGFD